MLSKRCMLVALALGTTWMVIQTAQARPVAPADAQTASIANAETVTAEPISGAPEPDCCPPPCIKYRHCGPKLCCGPCKPPKQIVLKVKNPCTCCEVEVPVCLPACCEGDPTVCCGKGFLCRDVVEYEWCCGFYVRVAFKRCGDLVVTTWGR
ncbi:MAG: hypothetical protein WD063_08390 [Pirellulales bacterium]